MARGGRAGEPPSLLPLFCQYLYTHRDHTPLTEISLTDCMYVVFVVDDVDLYLWLLLV